MITVTNSQALLTTHDVSYHYPNSSQPVLANINLTINTGDYCAIVGTSGSGKSTLLSILGLINKPTQGQYDILGKNTSNLSDKSVALVKNREIGFIFQNFNLLNHLSVIDNVALPLSYNTEVARSDYREKVEQALTKVNMLDFINRHPSQLSGGQQQRIAIARALVNNPSLVLADEPTGNLDSKNSESIFELMDNLHTHGATICLITHDKNYAQRATRCIEIQDGQLYE